jgi:AraC-like DNA-binding protein
MLTMFLYVIRVLYKLIFVPTQSGGMELNMFIDFGVNQNMEYLPQIIISRIFHLNADYTYHVIKYPNEPNYIAVIYTFDGSGEIKTSDRNFSLTPNTLFAIPLKEIKEYNTYNQLINKNDIKWGFWWLEVDAVTFPIRIKVLHSLQATEQEISLCQRCLELLKSENTGAVASAIANAVINMWSFKIGYNRSSGRLLFDQATTIMQKADFKDIKSLCSELSVSERTLRNIFYRNCGVSPKEYYNKTRLRISEELLRSTSLYIGEISARLNFSNQYHFSRAFSNEYGMSPTEYRKRGEV